MATKSYTKQQLVQELEQLKYNMLDCGMIADKILKNAPLEYKELKQLSHKALKDGRDAMEVGKLPKANSNFAFAYQTRCCCDWIWKHVLGNEGDASHATYLHISGEFSKLAAGKQELNEAEKDCVRKIIANIHD